MCSCLTFTPLFLSSLSSAYCWQFWRIFIVFSIRLLHVWVVLCYEFFISRSNRLSFNATRVLWIANCSTSFTTGCSKWNFTVNNSFMQHFSKLSFTDFSSYYIFRWLQNLFIDHFFIIAIIIQFKWSFEYFLWKTVTDRLVQRLRQEFEAWRIYNHGIHSLISFTISRDITSIFDSRTVESDDSSQGKLPITWISANFFQLQTRKHCTLK